MLTPIASAQGLVYLSVRSFTCCKCFLCSPSLSEKLLLSGMPQLERSELLLVDVKCSTCLCFHVPSTSAHLDRSSLEHRRSEMDFFVVSFHSIVRRNYMGETQCFFEPTKPTHRAFRLVSIFSSQACICPTAMANLRWTD